MTKKEDCFNLVKYAGLLLSFHLFQNVEFIHNDQILKHLEHLKHLSNQQYGFCKVPSIGDCLYNSFYGLQQSVTTVSLVIAQDI